LRVWILESQSENAPNPSYALTAAASTTLAAASMTLEADSMTLVGELRTMTRGCVTFILTALLLALPAAAEESPHPPGYYLFLESTVATADAADWASAVAQAAAGHARHPQGRVWSAYRKLTGGPDETVRFFFPLDRMGDLDEWRSQNEILTMSLGADRARAVISDLDLAVESGDRILSYSAKLSRPWPESHAPRYAWMEEVTVDDGKMVEYASLAKRLVGAFDEAAEEVYWVVYGTAIGGDSSRLLYIYGFDRFAELDLWSSRLEVLEQTLVEGESARLLAAIQAISETRSSLWQLEPELSRSEKEQ